MRDFKFCANIICVVVLAVTFCVDQPAASTGLTRNLLKNPGFEEPSLNNARPYDNWTLYGSWPRSKGWTNINNTEYPHSGTFFQVGGRGTPGAHAPDGYARQIVDVSGYGSYISSAKAIFGGWANAYSVSDDTVNDPVRFWIFCYKDLDTADEAMGRNISGNEEDGYKLGDSIGSNYTEYYSGPDGLWSHLEAELELDSSTEFIIFHVEFDYRVGSHNDGYADDVYLQLKFDAPDSSWKDLDFGGLYVGANEEAEAFNREKVLDGIQFADDTPNWRVIPKLDVNSGEHCTIFDENVEDDGNVEGERLSGRHDHTSTGGPASVYADYGADPYTGEKALMLRMGDGFEDGGHGWKQYNDSIYKRIVKEPNAEIEFRYMTFAWRKVGGKGIALKLIGQNLQTQKNVQIIYYAGDIGDIPVEIRSEPLGSSIPEEWERHTVNLWEDLGSSEKGYTIWTILFDTVDGHASFWDHIILHKDPEDPPYNQTKWLRFSKDTVGAHEYLHESESGSVGVRVEPPGDATPQEYTREVWVNSTFGSKEINVNFEVFALADPPSLKSPELGLGHQVNVAKGEDVRFELEDDGIYHYPNTEISRFERQLKEVDNLPSQDWEPVETVRSYWRDDMDYSPGDYTLYIRVVDGNGVPGNYQGIPIRVWDRPEVKGPPTEAIPKDEDNNGVFSEDELMGKASWLNGKYVGVVGRPVRLMAAGELGENGAADADPPEEITEYVWNVGVEEESQHYPQCSEPLYFDGSVDDYVITQPFDMPSEEVTIAFWMKADTEKNGTPVSYAVMDSDNEFLIYNYTNFEIWIGDIKRKITGRSAYFDGPHHIAVTWRSSDGQLKLYIDGDDRNQSWAVAEGVKLEPGGALVLGQEQDVMYPAENSRGIPGGFDPSQAFAGDLSDVAIWNGVLDEDEVNTVKNGSPLDVRPGDIAGLWLHEMVQFTPQESTRNRNITCKAVTNYGIESDEKKFGLKVYNDLVVDARGPYSGAAGQAMELRGGINTGDYQGARLVYQWKVTDLDPEQGGYEWVDLREKVSDPAAEYTWETDGVYEAEFTATVATTEGLQLTGSQKVRVKIEAGIPVANANGPYKGGIYGGNYSPIQFQGNEEDANTGPIADWVWSFGDPYSDDLGLLGEFYARPLLFDMDSSNDIVSGLNSGTVHQTLRDEFGANGVQLSGNLTVNAQSPGSEWRVTDNTNNEEYDIILVNITLNIYKYLEDLDEIEGLCVSPENIQVVSNVNIDSSGVGYSFFTRLTGFIKIDVPKEDYTFQVGSDYGFRLRIGKKDERTGLYFLETIAERTTSQDSPEGVCEFDSAGFYPMELIYFTRENSERVSLEWIEPGSGEATDIPDQLFLSGGIQTGVPDPPHAYKKAGKYTASLHVKSEAGKWSAAATAPVTVRDGTIQGVVRAADLRTPVLGVQLTLTSSHVDKSVLDAMALSEEILVCWLDQEFADDLDEGTLSDELRGEFTAKDISLSDDAYVSIEEPGVRWQIIDGDRLYTISKGIDKLLVYETREGKYTNPSPGVITAETDDYGSYSFERIPLGSYQIRASKVESESIHEFETDRQAAELTLNLPERVALDFVDLSVFPVGGLIRSLPYDLDEDSPETPDNSLLVNGVVVEAVPIGTTNSIRSTPSESTAGAGRNYSLPLFAGKYIFFAELSGRDIRLDLPQGIPYDLVDPENPDAGAIVTITGSTNQIHFVDRTERTLTIKVEDPGGFPIMYLEEDKDEENPVAATVTHTGASKSRTKEVDERLEDGEKETFITYSLPPGEYTIRADQQKFAGKGIKFRDEADSSGELHSSMDVDLTDSDSVDEITLVVPVPIVLELGPDPRLFSFKSYTDYEELWRFMTAPANADPPGMGLTDEEFEQLMNLTNCMFYWPPDPQTHTYGIRAMANNMPVEDFTLVVTDNVSQMTDAEATEQRIRVAKLFEEEDLGTYRESLNGAADNGNIVPPGVKGLFDDSGNSLSENARVYQYDPLSDPPEDKWIITDPDGDGERAYFLRGENGKLYADEGAYTVMGGLPAMSTSDPPEVQTKTLSLQATKKGYQPSEIVSANIYVLGDRAIGAAPELIAKPEVNYVVLHDPPGDCSYSFIDDSVSVKGVIDNMTIHAPDGTSIPVYPSPWGRGQGIIGSQSYDGVNAAVFGRAAAIEAAVGGVSTLVAMGSGPVGYGIQLIKWGLNAGSMHREEGPWAATWGIPPMVQYSIRANRKLETMPTEEMLDVELPDLTGPGRGDIYYGEGWTIGIQEKWRLGLEPDDGGWEPATVSIATFDILDRENQYIYTARDIENVIADLDMAELSATGKEQEEIDETREKWIGLLKLNPAYLWSEFYVGYSQEELEALRAKDNRTGLENFRLEMLEVSEQYINANGDEFAAFKAACVNGSNEPEAAEEKGYGWYKDWVVPEDNEGDVETLLFRGGTSFEYSRTISQSVVTTFLSEAIVGTSANAAGEMHTGPKAPDPAGTSPAKWENIWQIGASLSFTTQQTISRSVESGEEVEQKVGFILQDNDVGDSIATRVYADPFYGTPLFIHDRGSVTSDPWEPGTNRGIDVNINFIPSGLDLRFGIDYNETTVSQLDELYFPLLLRQAFEANGIPSGQPVVEMEEPGSRWIIKVPQVGDTPATDYAVRREFDMNNDELLNVYEVLIDQGPFDYHRGANYKVKVTYTGRRDLESDFTTFDFMLYAPQMDNRDNLTVRFNDQNGAYETYKVGLTKESPAANIAISVYPPEVDQENWYEREYSAIILVQEVKDAQINRQIALTPRFADLRPPKVEITAPYPGQRIGPAMFGAGEDAFAIEVVSEDRDIKEIKIQKRSKRQDGVWSEWSSLPSTHGSDVKWQSGEEFTELGGNPPRRRYTFKWTGGADGNNDIMELGVGEYQLTALATDKADNSNQYHDPPVIDFMVDASKPTVLTTVPDYQARDKERIYRSELSASFTDDMRADDFTPTTFHVLDLLEGDPLKKDVSGFVSYSPALRKAVFVPEIPFRANGFYQATLSVDIHDLAGNPLDNEFSWTFRTADAPFEPTWSITLKAINNEGLANEQVDANNVAGVEYGALDGEDEKDARSVPPIDTQMSLSFLNEYKEKFDRDIRPADGRLSHHWFFVIGNAKAGKVTIKYKPSHKLIWPDPQNEPYEVIRLVEFDAYGNASAPISLYPADAWDPNKEEIVEIEAYNYDIVQDGDMRYFRLDVQKADLVATQFQVGTSGWKFFSVPITPERADPFVNLGDDIDPFQMYQYDTATGGYKIYPLDLGEVSLQRGHGYFTRLYCDVEVDVGRSSDMSDMNTLELEAEGWHAIGNPFPKEVDIADLKVNGYVFGTSSANDLVENTLYRWKTDGAGDTYEAVDQFSQLLPWEGYWIKTKEDKVTITIPKPSGSDDAYNVLPDSYKPPVMAPPAVDSRRITVQPGEFDLRLELTSSSSADTTTTLGVRQKARMDWDPMDQSEPPILGETVAAYFHHPDWGDDSGSYNRDYRPVLSVGDERTWSVTVYTDKPDSQMKLSWEESISQVPDDVMLYFRRADTAVDDDWQDMRKVRSIDLESRLQFTSIPVEIRVQRYEMGPPSGVQAIPGEKLVALRWEPDDNEFIEGYIITRQDGSAEDWRDGEGVSYTINNVSEFVDRDVLEEVTYTYQLRVRFMSGAELGSQLFTVRTLPIIKQTALMRCYPNPFNPEVWIPYDLAEEASVSVGIYSVSGQLVRTLDLGVQQRGRYASRDKAAHWDGLNQAGEKAASGVYFYVLKAGKFSASKKMVLVR